MVAVAEGPAVWLPSLRVNLLKALRTYSYGHSFWLSSCSRCCMARVIRTFICTLVLVNFSSAQQISSSRPQTATMLGTVLDVTGATVPNAHVVLQGVKEPRIFITADNGFFQFGGIEPGMPVRVDVSAPDFQSWSSNEIVLQPGESFIVTDISLAVANVVTAVSAASPEEIAIEQVRAQEQQRVLGIVPNFFVTYKQDAAPLTPKLKFQLSLKALTDPVTIAGFGMNAAIYQAADYPGYSQGAAGYAKRLGATFAGGYSKILLGDALFPTLFHQDPRYFYQGTGTTKSRLLHAMATPFFTRGDNGNREINYSNLLGDLASGALANAYYPSQDRGARLVVRSAAIGVAGRMAFGIVQEFVLHKWTTRQ